MLSRNLLLTFKASPCDFWFDFDDQIPFKSKSDLVVDRLLVPGVSDVYGVLLEAQHMVIFKDVLNVNGVMWYELEEIKQEYLKRQRRQISSRGKLDMRGVSVGVFGFENNKRVILTFCRLLKREGVKVCLFAQKMRLKEYLSMSNDFEVYCVEILI